MYKHPWIKNKPSTSMVKVACESKLRSVMRSSIKPCPRNREAIGRLFVYAHAFSAGIKSRHCTTFHSQEFIELIIKNWSQDVETISIYVLPTHSRCAEKIFQVQKYIPRFQFRLTQLSLSMSLYMCGVMGHHTYSLCPKEIVQCLM